jgi:hypothetical protein
MTAPPTPKPVSSSGVPTADAAFRKTWWAYVLRDADEWHRTALARLFEHWRALNTEFYNSAMLAPYILLAEPTNPRRYADTGPTSGFGGRCQIRIRPSLLDGRHPAMQNGIGNPEGRYRFVADVLAHEQIHQWQQEITGRRENGDHGHGAGFATKCNEIGTAWGLPEVRRRGGKVNCAHWPENVRPANYYLGAYHRTPESPLVETPCPHCQGTGRLPTSLNT